MKRPYHLAITLLILFATAYLITASPLSSRAINLDNHYEQAITLGGEWFLNNQNENFIYYEYDPYTDTHDDDTHELREMGALWSITQLANFTGDERYDQLADNGIKYFLQYLAEDTEHDFTYFNINPDKVKLGYNAFLILALLESNHPDKDEIMAKLANGIVYHQLDDGSLDTFFFSDRDTSVDYYPGEALLALMSLYEATGNDEYKKTVTNALAFYTNYFRTNPNTAFAPWQSRAYAKLYQINPNENIANYIFEMNDYVLERYSPRQDCQHFTFDKGVVTAVHAEGVVQAYDIAKLTGDEDRARCYQNFIQESADYIITLQESNNTPLPVSAIGGFWGNVAKDSMRVDRNQHAVMLIMDAYSRGLI